MSPRNHTRAEQAQMLDDAATFYLRYNPSRSPADDAWPDALRAGAESLRQRHKQTLIDDNVEPPSAAEAESLLKLVIAALDASPAPK